MSECDCKTNVGELPEGDKIYLYTEEGVRQVFYKTYPFAHKKCAYCDKMSTHFSSYGVNNLRFSGYLCDTCKPNFTREEIRNSYLVPCTPYIGKVSLSGVCK